MAKRALQVAAAGGHGVIMVGPPGSGKTMLAQRFGSILPSLSEEERLETALIHSVVGEDVVAILAGRRPFRSPHHSATAAGLIGGGSPPHPGEASLAHNGVLFLDEMSEFKASVLQTLRQPLENGGITLTRADGTYSFPARFQLLAATNPCPCGYFGDPTGRCKCSPAAVQMYQNRIGGPLLDRIDIRIDVWRSDSRELLGREAGKGSSELREGVERARAFRKKRACFGGNSDKPGKSMRYLRDACCFSAETEEFFLALAESKELSARALAKTLLLARTIADIEEQKQVSDAHVAEAFGLRFGGGLKW